jgi:UDPglucose--hexose-1-phosphate uridylyltransferase
MPHIIDKLLAYAEIHLGLSKIDIIYKRNELLFLLGESDVEQKPVNLNAIKNMSVPDQLLNELKHIFLNQGIKEEELEHKIGNVIGILTPNPSEVNKKFNQLYKQDSKLATEYLYDLQIKNDYIKKTFIDKNIHWIAHFDKNKSLEMAINMAKPEKHNKDIARLASLASNDYPRCVLCKENVGYYGRLNYPSRKNIRVIDLNLDQEGWFFQYSPYVYYPRHCIVIDDIHRPMIVNQSSIRKLFAFVDQFPHFFIGSNSDLPIVGGSILNHEHFQGGQHLMPLMKAKSLKRLYLNKFVDLDIHLLDWFNTTFFLTSKDKDKLIMASDYIISKWRNYNDEDVDIINKTDKQHNTATVILKKDDDMYSLYIALRNNRCDKRYPTGIFHAHPEHHHIKHEGIGLIEVLGLFILPARLKRQFDLIEEMVQKTNDIDEIFTLHKELEIFAPLIKSLVDIPQNQISNTIRDHVNQTCKHILENISVFKNDERGQQAFNRFFDYLNH